MYVHNSQRLRPLIGVQRIDVGWYNKSGRSKIPNHSRALPDWLEPHKGQPPTEREMEYGTLALEIGDTYPHLFNLRGAILRKLCEVKLGHPKAFVDKIQKKDGLIELLEKWASAAFTLVSRLT